MASREAEDGFWVEYRVGRVDWAFGGLHEFSLLW
jgi:hypothetical protein